MLAEVRPSAGKGHQFHRNRKANRDERYLARQYRRQVVRLRRLNGKDQHPERVEKLEHHLLGAGRVVRLCHLIAASGKADPERVQRLRARREVSHPRHLNAANAQADPPRRERLIYVLRRRNMTDHLRVSQAKVQIQRAVLGMFRRNRGTGDLNLRGSVLRPRQRARAQMSRWVLSIGHRRESVSRVVRRRVQAVLLKKRAAQEK